MSSASARIGIIGQIVNLLKTNRACNQPADGRDGTCIWLQISLPRAGNSNHISGGARRSIAIRCKNVLLSQHGSFCFCCRDNCIQHGRTGKTFLQEKDDGNRPRLRREGCRNTGCLGRFLQLFWFPIRTGVSLASGIIYGAALYNRLSTTILAGNHA